jgi:ribosomal protein L37E
MIQRKKKICRRCGRERYIYAKGLCNFCYGLEQARKKRERNKALSPSSGGKIPLKGRSSSYGLKTSLKQRSDKRAEQEKEYNKVKRQIMKEQRACFFCGKEIKEEQLSDTHHLKGRDGDLLTDKKYLVHVHRKCHDLYHFKSIHKWPWKDAFLSRLKKLNESLYNKEIAKLDKT